MHKFNHHVCSEMLWYRITSTLIDTVSTEVIVKYFCLFIVMLDHYNNQ